MLVRVCACVDFLYLKEGCLGAVIDLSNYYFPAYFCSMYLCWLISISWKLNLISLFILKSIHMGTGRTVLQSGFLGSPVKMSFKLRSVRHRISPSM